MGFRTALKRSLRLGWHRGRSGWQRLTAPLQVGRDRDRLRSINALDQVDRDRDRLRSINALDRIQEVRLPGGAGSGLDRLVLFSHFHPKGWLQRCIRRELADLRQRGWQVLLLTDSLDAEGLAWCESQEIGWLRRRNEGRDFGAFQDGWLLLRDRGLSETVERLVMLNDSVYPVVNLEASSWPRFLEAQDDSVVGFSDSFQNGYHLQSYALHLPGAVLQQPWWESYWANYPGWGGMTIAIREGEIGLSQLLLNQGVALKALHPVSKVRAQLASAHLLEQLELHCSKKASQWIQQQLLSTGLSSLNCMSPAHYWAIPLLLDGCPFVKRWLMESNVNQMLDPLLVAGGQVSLVDPDELLDYLRPPVGEFAG